MLPNPATGYLVNYDSGLNVSPCYLEVLLEMFRGVLDRLRLYHIARHNGRYLAQKLAPPSV